MSIFISNIYIFFRSKNKKRTIIAIRSGFHVSVIFGLANKQLQKQILWIKS